MNTPPTPHACEVGQLPEPYAITCSEVGVLVIHDRFGFEHWVCRWHEAELPVYLEQLDAKSHP